MSEEVRCNICGGPTTLIEVKEQMLGLSETFTYYSCLNCGHTHLENPPENLSKYYNPDEYYSFRRRKLLVDNLFVNTIKKILLQAGPVNNLFFSCSLKAVLKTNQITKATKILDYGCGAGQFVNELLNMGFKNATGFDPFLPVNKSKKEGIYLANKIDSLYLKKWDIVVLSHVLEHLHDPIEILKSISSLLNPNGLVVLRFPVIDSYAFKKYRENWVQFDAPRHLNLFTRKSIKFVLQNLTEFTIVSCYDDSFHFQFTGSELYMRKKTLNRGNSSQVKRLLSFSTYKYHFLAKKLNRRNQGDQIVVVLKKSDSQI
jgi:SAM-dependent methyltransferase